MNCENIEGFSSGKDDKLQLVYFIPDPKDQSKFLRKQEQYDCCENRLILKTFTGIQNRIIEQQGGKEQYQAHIEQLGGKETGIQKQTTVKPQPKKEGEDKVRPKKQVPKMF